MLLGMSPDQDGAHLDVAACLHMRLRIGDGWVPAGPAPTPVIAAVMMIHVVLQLAGKMNL